MIDKRQLIASKKRKNTDFGCLVCYLSFSMVLLIAGLYCFITGSPSKFNTPYDSSGKGCGIDYPNHPYIYFPSPQYNSLWVTTCVAQCPTASSTSVTCKPNVAVTSCQPNNSANNAKAFHIYPTILYQGNICMPIDSVIAAVVQTGIGNHPLEQIFGSTIQDWSLFLIMLPIIMAMSLLAILLIRLTAGYVIYVLYSLSILAFIGFGVFLLLPPPASAPPFVLKQNKIVAIAVAVCSFLLAMLIFCIFCTYKQRIKMAVYYINQSNQFFKNNCNLLILPFVLTALLTLFTSFWMFLNFSFFNINKPTSQLNQLPFQHFQLTLPAVAALFVNLFYFVWGVFFLIHTGVFIVSGTLVNWAFQRPKCYSTSFKTYFASHLGSVCMGSFLTTLLGAIKIQLDQIDCSQRQPNQEDNRCIDCLKRCYSCFCCCCLAFVFKCFHRTAYVYQNLTGFAYCQSSSEVYQLIRGHRQQWSIISFLYMIMDSFVPFAITIANIIISNTFIQTIPAYSSSTSNRILVFVTVAVLSYSVSQFFIGIYAQAIESIFIIKQFHRTLLPHRDMYPLELDTHQIQNAQKPPLNEQYRVSQSSKVGRYSLFTNKV